MNYLKNLSDKELVQVVDELQKAVHEENSIVRTLSKQYLGEDNLTTHLALNAVLLLEITERFKHYSPYID